jgi:CRISPR-associated protein Cas1
MVTLYVSHEDGILGRRGDALFYKKGRVGDGETIPTHLIDDVVILGNGAVSTPAIHFMMDNDIPLHFVDSGGRYKGSSTSGRSRGYSIKRLQFNAACSDEATLRIARPIVSGKIVNQLKTLRRARSRRGKDAALSQACEDLRELPAMAAVCSDIDTLRGMEGFSAAVYFSVFGRIIRPQWFFHGRNRRPPRDPVNAMLSFGYTLLLGHVTSAAVTAGLDPCVGFLHPEHRGRPSMALDLMEEFRAQVTDRLVIAIANQMLLKPENFTQTDDGGVSMDVDTKKIFIRLYLERLNERVKNENSGNTSSFRNHIFASAASFVASLRSGNDYVPFSISSRD